MYGLGGGGQCSHRSASGRATALNSAVEMFDLFGGLLFVVRTSDSYLLNPHFEIPRVG